MGHRLTVKQIPLTKGKCAVVDDLDYDYLIQWKWYAIVSGLDKKTHYAARWGDKKPIYMHRIVAEHIGLNIKGKRIDHKNRCGLDNRRKNLRIATVSQNRANGKPQRCNTSGYKGVSWCRDTRNGEYVFGQSVTVIV